MLSFFFAAVFVALWPEQAEARAHALMERDNDAKERGDKATAERHYARAQAILERLNARSKSDA